MARDEVVDGCKLAPKCDPLSNHSYHNDSVRKIRAQAGSRSAPIGTPHPRDVYKEYQAAPKFFGGVPRRCSNTNRLAETSSWDDRLLGEILRDLAAVELDFDLEATGFSIGEIDLRIEGLSASTGSEADPADQLWDGPDQPPVTRPGDLWHLARHRLLQPVANDLTHPGREPIGPSRLVGKGKARAPYERSCRECARRSPRARRSFLRPVPDTLKARRRNSRKSRETFIAWCFTSTRSSRSKWRRASRTR